LIGFAIPFALGVVAGVMLAIIFFSDPDRFPPEDK
jgi:hypothetical protein